MTVAELTVVLVAVAVGSMVKGVSGLGPSVIVVPILGTFVGVEAAVVIFAVPALMSNVLVVRRFSGELRSTRHLPAIVVPGAIGAAVGSLVLTSVDEGLLAIVVGALVVAYAVLFVTSPQLTAPPAVARRLSPVVGLLAGVMQGTAGFCGPVVGAWLHSFRLPRSAYLVSVSTVFALIGVAQVGTLAVLGRFTWDRAGAAALALAGVVVFVPIGMRVGRHIGRTAFDRVIVLLLLGSAAWLVIDTNL